MSRRTPRIALALVAALALWAPAASQGAFGIKEADIRFESVDGGLASQAGAHPYAFTTSFSFNTRDGSPVPFELPDGSPKDVTIAAIPGLAGNPTATPRCPTLQFLQKACPPASQLGYTDVTYSAPDNTERLPVYNLDPPPGVAAKLGFTVTAVVPVTVEAGVNPNPPYNVIARVPNASQTLPVYGASTTLWGNPPGATTPFLTLPRACRGPLPTFFAADSWEHPGAFVEPPPVFTHDESEPPQPRGFGECSKLGLGAEITAQPTSRAASSPSGLDFALDVQSGGLGDPAGVANSDIEKTEVTLPRGMSVNPSQAEGLEACSEAGLARETAFSAPGDGCPEASKIGAIEVETPLLEDEVLKGSLFLAEPYRNLAGNSLIAFYIVIQDPELGIVVKQPARVQADPATGQLIATTEEMPQVPFSHFRLHFREGARSPLITPPACGSYDVKAKLYPYSGNPPLLSTSTFRVISGPGGSPCPASPPFHPGFEAGTENNAAGHYSPFLMHVTRSDGEQDMGRFSFVLPEGVVPKLAGIPYCPDAAIARAIGRTGEHGGQEELDAPSCPAASQIGRTLAGAGAGSQLTYVPGKLYLAGPYHGDPISAVAITPAVAGPFDAGTVVVREALSLNPVTYQGEVDGSASDPIPHILKGIPLNLRDLRVYADKPEFTLNATSCAEEHASSTIWGEGTALQPLGGTPATLSSRYQAASCASLPFRPRLGLKLRGGTGRGKFPALHAVYTPRPGDANLASLALTFPRSEFVEQGHFRTICTRVQFAAGAGFGSECPAGSVYGHIKAWSPLLSEPLEGPVYLRSSNHNLPDAVFALHGLVDIEVPVRIDSSHGRLRATVSDSPDAPVSRAIVDMQGGQKGLFVNSANLCAGKHRAKADVTGQNGRNVLLQPLTRAVACGKRGR